MHGLTRLPQIPMCLLVGGILQIRRESWTRPTQAAVQESPVLLRQHSQYNFAKNIRGERTAVYILPMRFAIGSQEPCTWGNHWGNVTSPHQQPTRNGPLAVTVKDRSEIYTNL